MAGVTFIDELLQDQRELTAVDQFAQWHESLAPAAPGRYHRLLPATAPGPGQQYSFEVDLDRCSGCKACVTACHSLNGLDDDESWRAVGLLISPSAPTPWREVPPVQQHITTACHHCVDPACLHGCPVLAYDKDPVTGVVRHLDDQCMGCSYCVMKCPYEVPRYSKRLGIVRKCDMCSNRLAVGEAPACAQACPSAAIRIAIVDQAEVRERYREDKGAAGPVEAAARPMECRPDDNAFLPDSPPPAVTLPTTRFVSRRVLPKDVCSADRGTLRLDPGHGPLVAMLVLTQAAAGLLGASAVTGLWGYQNEFPVLNGFAGLLLVLGLAGSVLHLGRPSKAWRAFLGWRRSWLSREIIAFNIFAGATVAACLPFWPQGIWPVTVMAGLAGMLAVFASSMVYVDTGRAAWRGFRTFGDFFGTTLLLGATLAAATFASMNQGSPGTFANAAWNAAVVAMLMRTVLFVWRRRAMGNALADTGSSVHWNARVIEELLPGTTRWANLLFVVSTCAGLLALMDLGGHTQVWALLAAASTVSSEFIGRHVFFAAGGTKRMPGVPTL